VQYVGPDGTRGGTVVYLGGHDYSPAVSGSGGQTAGTRIILNTLFNLGFACSDPTDAAGNPVACSTGYPSTSACALGTLKCGGSGGLTCVPNVKPGDQPEVCGDGIDNDCNGQVDDNLSRSCSNACGVGAESCHAGSWGGCDAPQQTAEKCDGLDNDCDGQVDEPDAPLCDSGDVCVDGACQPGNGDGDTGGMQAGCSCNSSGLPNAGAVAPWLILGALLIRRRRR